MLQFSFQYRPLFTCTFQHAFFADQGSALFSMMPTAETELLLKRLGLIFKNGNGIANCLYDPEKVEALILELQREKELVLKFWADVKADAFINITDMPVDSIGKLYYFTNTVHVKEADAQVWHSNAAANEENLLPLYQQLQLPDSWIGKDLTLKSDKAVLKTWKAESKSVPLNLPTGKYSIGNDSIGWTSFIHSKEIGIKRPLAYLEVSLTNGQLDKILSDLIDHQYVGPRGIVRFAARTTSWRYYIVQKYNIASDRFKIHTNDRKVEFTGPEEVKLPSGEKALLFSSNITLPLMQKITHNFQLKNKDGKILVHRLPVAATDQIIPENQSGISKIFSDIKVYV